MPTYAYACTACDHRFEAQQSFTDASLTECPQCQGQLRKLFNSVGIVFKGSGFYRTDSRAGTPSGGSAAKKESSDNGSTSPGSTSPGSSSTSSSSTSSSATSSGSSSRAKAASGATTTAD